MKTIFDTLADDQVRIGMMIASRGVLGATTQEIKTAMGIHTHTHITAIDELLQKGAICVSRAGKRNGQKVYLYAIR